MVSDIKSRVTIGFVNYNNLQMLNECIGSVLSQKGGPYRLIFVDNASTDGSLDYVKKKYSDVLEIIILEQNAGPNPARNIILKMTDTEFVLFVDADVVLEDDVVVKLIEVLDSKPQAAIASPIVMDYSKKSEVQFCGTKIHYIGAAIHPNWVLTDTYEVTTLGGACLLVRKSAADAINGWDEDLFFGWTDGDFVYRIVLAGYKAFCVSSTKIYHPYKKRGMSKAYHQVRNRWYFVLKTYSWRTLLIILPMVMLYELLLLSFLTLKRQTLTYFRANFAVFRSLPLILEKRRVVQRLRKVRDREALTTGDITIRDGVQAKPWLSKFISIFNRGLDAYWLVVRRVC